MNDFKSIITENFLYYSKSELQDILKLIYQNEFGCGHLVSNYEKCYDMVLSEYDNAISAKNLFENIGNGYTRINLGNAREKHIPPNLIAKIFFMSAQKKYGSKENFITKANIIKSLCDEKVLPYKSEEVDKFISAKIADDFAPFSHSEKYHNFYNPSYRVILDEFKIYLPLLYEILNRQNQKTVIAIDGKCGSGKSTLATMISQIVQCNIIHMDDFFLPFAMKTDERMAESGGNVHYERFITEILPNLNGDKPFEYGIFDCSQGCITNNEKITPKNITIIEGSYSLHPIFQKYYNLSVFLDTGYEKQCDRILKRNGEFCLEKFKSKWIPLENKYFHSYNIKEKANYCINTDLFLY